jgi:hypothetical protein
VPPPLSNKHKTNHGFSICLVFLFALCFRCVVVVSNGNQQQHKNECILIHVRFALCFVAPCLPPSAPKTAPEHPRELQGSPRHPKGTARPPKDSSKTLQVSPKTSHASPETPREPQDTPPGGSASGRRSGKYTASPNNHKGSPRPRKPPDRRNTAPESAP